MYLWGPITLVILTHLLSNKPFSSSSAEILTKNLTQTDEYINVIAGGLIHLASMTIISFIMFVLFKVINSTGVHSLFQHINLSSYVGINTIIFSLICSSGISYLIIPCALIYILGCSYLHINAYNRALKPQLIELIIMSILLIFFYTCTGNFLLIKQVICFTIIMFYLSQKLSILQKKNISLIIQTKKIICFFYIQEITSDDFFF